MSEPSLSKELLLRAFTRLDDRLDRRALTADELGLPRWWLNEQASSYLPSGHEAEGPSVFVGRALRVMTADPELLLAMKVRAARTGDRADIVLMADRMGLSTATAVLSVAERVFEEPVPDRQRQVIEDLFLR